MENLEIGEIARRAGIRASAIRYYEGLGLLRETTRVNGRRRYNADILLQLQSIQIAQQAGFTLGEIGTLFSGFSADTPVSQRWREMANRKIAEVDGLIAKGQRMKQLLELGLECGCVEIEDCRLLLGPDHTLTPTI
jgi:MerR family transcriptional regulator, redox-sensitive transcriptional activator SoxR